MTQAKDGNTVKVHYTGKLDNGNVFDSSAEREPLQFKIGEAQIIPGFQEVVIGMKPGESKTAKIPADKAYGSHRKDKVVTIDKNQLPQGMDPKLGQELQAKGKDEQTIPLLVTDVSESSVTFDTNHPLAGKDLTFDIQLIEITS